MSSQKNHEEFYRKLKEQLYDTSSWPSEYLYKFSVPTDKDKIDHIQNVFNNMGAVISTKESRGGNYTSVSINVKMNSPERGIKKYREITDHVEGVIAR